MDELLSCKRVQQQKHTQKKIPLKSAFIFCFLWVKPWLKVAFEIQNKYYLKQKCDNKASLPSLFRGGRVKLPPRQTNWVFLQSWKERLLADGKKINYTSSNLQRKRKWMLNCRSGWLNAGNDEEHFSFFSRQEKKQEVGRDRRGMCRTSNCAGLAVETWAAGLGVAWLGCDWEQREQTGEEGSINKDGQKIVLLFFFSNFNHYL